jgi:penicillin-binding protein 1A
MARAYAVFANQGRDVTPIAIRSIEDRNGRIIFDVEGDVRRDQRRMGSNVQVISPQNAYVMTRILEKTVEIGSLASGSGWGAKFTFRDENDRSFRMPVAGKTGTTQNWSDAWAVGYSPYYTTAVWFGFDRPGNSLGLELTGATLSGHVWGDYMREIHRGLPRRSFSRPTSGVVDVTVCAKSGLLRTAACNEGEVTLPFLEGTQPYQYCEIHGSTSFDTRISISTIPYGGMDTSFLDSLAMPQLPSDILELLGGPTQPANRNQQNRTQANNNANNRNNSLFTNPLLDDGPPSGTPQSNVPGNRSEPQNFPDVVTQYVPGVVREEDDYGGYTGNAYDDELPSWNPLN